MGFQNDIDKTVVCQEQLPPILETSMLWFGAITYVSISGIAKPPLLTLLVSLLPPASLTLSLHCRPSHCFCFHACHCLCMSLPASIMSMLMRCLAGGIDIDSYNNLQTSVHGDHLSAMPPYGTAMRLITASQSFQVEFAVIDFPRSSDESLNFQLSALATHM